MLTLLLPPTVMNLFSKLRSCPNEQQLAEYADQQLIGKGRVEIEHHLASCEECSRQVGFLVRTAEKPPLVAPDELVRRARNLVKSGDSVVGRWSWWPTAIAVALIVLAVGTWKLSKPTSSQPEASTSAPVQQAELKQPVSTVQHESEQVRGEVGVGGPSFLTPKSGAKLASQDIRFEWQPVTDQEYYEFQLMTETGDLVWQTRLQGTSLLIPATIHLNKGQWYYALLRAHSRTLGVVSPAPVRFTVE